MMIVDAYTGQEGLQIGDRVAFPSHFSSPAFYIVKDILDHGFFNVRMLMELHEGGVIHTSLVPLTVRIFHPLYLFQRIAFVES